MTGHYGRPLSRPWQLCHECLLFNSVCPTVPFPQTAAAASAPLTWLGYDITKHRVLEKKNTHTQGQGKGQGVHRLCGEGGWEQRIPSSLKRLEGEPVVVSWVWLAL